MMGMRVGVLIGSILTTTGLAIQCLIEHSLAWALLGHTITALAWPFLWNAHTLVVAELFERKINVMLSTSAVMGGLALGYILSDWIVGSYSGFFDFQHERVKANVDTLLHGIKLASFVQVVLVAIFFQKSTDDKKLLRDSG